ncbi:hypothetical protein [Chitinibacter tainanensis]|uniref:hypothetical protein n=1 Tax=Chitinibacter tainanensis TaxID=230667 RepID=UPI0023530E33|nr:hypothetical protein [Chitinibacter tainanensis]
MIDRTPPTDLRPCWYYILVKGCLFWGLTCSLLLAALWHYSGTYPNWIEGVWAANPMAMIAGGIYGFGQWGFARHQAFKARLQWKEDNDEQ